MNGTDVSRRALLAALSGSALSAAAGCLSSDSDDAPSDTEADDSMASETEADGSAESDDEATGTDDEEPRPSSDDQSATDGATVDAGWPTTHQNAQRNPVLPDRSGPQSEPVRRWAVELPADDDRLVEHAVEPVVRDGRVFAQTIDGECLALDADSGDRLWTRSVPRDGLATSAVTPVATDDAVVVASYGLQALDAADGSERWQVPLDGTLHNQTIAGDLLVASDLNAVVAVDATSGEVQWRVDELQDPTFPAVDEAGEHVLTVDHFDEAVVCLDAATGDERWRHEPETQDGADFLTLADGTAYVASPLGGTLTAFDVPSGDVQGTAELTLPDESAVTDDVAYVPTGFEDQRLTALDPTELSEQPDRSLDAAIVGPPVVTSDAILGWQAGDVTGSAADETGMATDQTSIVALDRSSGEKRWTVDLESPVEGFAVTEDTVVCYSDGEIVALEA